jgi:hypothetical protein
VRRRGTAIPAPVVAWIAALLLGALASLAPAEAAAAGKPSSTDPDCLTVTRTSPATFLIENDHCPKQSVLTTIEVTSDGEGRCFTKKIRSQLSLASAGAMPLVNFQCIEGKPGCSIEALRVMFPDCHAN